MKIRGNIDHPAEGELVYQHGFQVRGWASTGDGRPWKAIVARIDDDPVGASTLQLPRPDVAEFLGLEDDARTGFVVRCEIAQFRRSAGALTLTFFVVDLDDTWTAFAKRTVRLSEIDYRIHGHGYMLADGPERVLVRDQVYGSGPPSPHADRLCVDLVMSYLQPGESVLDVGCGIGAYYHALTPYGIDWTGCERRSDFVERMLAEGLRAELVTGRLPFADKQFDATICIEVLEHVPEYEQFLAEVSRVSRRAAVFSVPNFGAVPVTSSRYALPWHMLESDHHNFFTVRSLAQLLRQFYRDVETFEYGPLQDLHSTDGITINNHVFAVCRH